MDSADLLSPEVKMKEFIQSTKELSLELSKLLIVILARLINEKVEETKIFHWCWKFTRGNIPIMSSVMSATHHVSSLDSVKSALRDPTIWPLRHPSENKCLPLDNKFLKLEGCYLFYDEK